MAISVLALSSTAFCANSLSPSAEDQHVLGDASGLSVIPQPAIMQPADGSFTLSAATRILVDESAGAGEAAAYLIQWIERSAGLRLQYGSLDESSSMANAIVLARCADDERLGEEGYTLDVTPQGVRICAPRPAGVFYGVQTLLQLTPQNIFAHAPDSSGSTPWTLPAVSIVDAPRFAWRGLMLDASRHFQSVDFVKRYLDLMALHKLNVFHWHLVDGHGWRIEIKKYPKLTEVGAWRNQPGYPTPGETGRYGGFYTQDEIREVVAYARARHITIVPEIEMPGHSWAAIAAYPHLSCTGQTQDVAYFFDYPCTEQRFPQMEGSDVFCAGREETFTFLEDVLSEVMTLFPSTYIHIGGDEVDKKWWRECEACQHRITEEGLKDEDELQSVFIKRIEVFLNAHDRRLIGWDEILEGGLAPNAAVMSWRGTQGGIAAAQSGHNVVMSPNKALYLDHFQSTSPCHPPSWPGLNTLRTVYDYEPIPAELTAEQAVHVLGAQGNMWTCFTHTDELVELMTYPRACALAEITWSPKAARDWECFMRRMEKHEQRLDALGVRRFKDAAHVIGSWSPTDLTDAEASLTCDVTELIDAPGRFTITLKYARGAHGLECSGIVLMEHERVVARDEHVGFAGWKHERNQYMLDVESHTPGAVYTILIALQGSGGSDSHGTVIFSREEKDEDAARRR